MNFVGEINFGLYAETDPPDTPTLPVFRLGWDLYHILQVATHWVLRNRLTYKIILHTYILNTLNELRNGLYLSKIPTFF